jgi:hypothetical protein
VGILLGIPVVEPPNRKSLHNLVPASLSADPSPFSCPLPAWGDGGRIFALFRTGGPGEFCQ